MTLQHILKNSSQSGKEPLASQLANGEIALNYHADGPFLTCKDTAGAVRRLTGVWVGASAPGSPTPGELWLDISITPNQLKIYKDSTDSWVFAGNVANASTSAVGVVELATDAETQAGSDTQRAVTPASLQSKISDSTVTVSATTIASSSAIKTTYDLANAALPKTGGTVTGALEIGTTGSLRFEGLTANDFETTLAVTDPTADRTITLPNVSGTVITTGDTGTVTSTMIADGTIVNSDVSASAAIAGTKISPDFGSQNVATTGTSTAARFIPTSSTVPTNGVYLPAANSVAISTGSTGRLFIDSSGRLLVGTSSNRTGAALQVEGTSFGTSLGTITNNSPNSAPAYFQLIKSRGTSVGSQALVANGDGLGNVQFVGTDGTQQLVAAAIEGIVDGTPGANNMPGRLVFFTTADGASSPTERLRITSAGLVGVGTSAPVSSLTIFGNATLDANSFYSSNLYYDGSNWRYINNGYAGYCKLADSAGFINFAAAPLNSSGAGAVAAPANRLTISPSGTTEFLAATSTSPAVFKIAGGEVARIDSSGRLLVGTSSALASAFGTFSPRLQVATTASGPVSFMSYTNDAFGARLDLSKSRGTSVGTNTVVQATDDLGEIYFNGADGTNFIPAGLIRCEVDGTPGANDMPGRLVFSTTADGTSSPTERMRISSSGQIAVAGAGSASAPTITKNDDLNTGIFFPAADTIAFAEGGTESARFDSSGRLGIGVTSVSNKLTVRDSSETAIVSTAAIENYITGNPSSGNGVALDFNLNNNGNATVNRGRIAVVNTNFHAESEMRFYTATSNAIQQRMVLDSSGRLLVGTNTAAPSLASGIGLDSTIGRKIDLYYSTTIHMGLGVDLSGGPYELSIYGPAGNANQGKITFGFISAANPGTWTEAMRLDASGRLLVGTTSAKTAARPFLGTASPVTPLGQFEGYQIYTDEASRCFMLRGNSTSDIYPYFALVRSKGNAIGSNTAVANGDNIGAISFQGMDGTNPVEAASIVASVDGAPGANDMPGRLVFSTTADGASSPTERMRIGSNGLSILFVSTADGFQTRNSAAAGTSYACFAGRHSATSTQDGTLSYVVWSNGNVQNSNNSYGAFSDIKLKENIADANSQWDDIKALQVRNYNLIEGQTHRQIGLIAQEVEPISPGLVYESLDRDEDGNDLGTVTKSVNYSVLYMKAVKALQEAMERIETLEAKVAALESA